MPGCSLQHPVTGIGAWLMTMLKKPFMRAEFPDWGILVRLRYHTVPAQRQEVSTYTTGILLREFGKEYPRVRFAMPESNIRYKLDDARGTQQAAAPPNAG